jgi:hypothetical protein
VVHLPWLSAHGFGRQRELAAGLVEYILQRAKEKGEESYEKAREIVEEGRARGSLRLAGFVREVWVGKRRHTVRTFGCSVAVGGSGLLHVAVSAEIDGVKDVYVLSFGRFGGSIRGFAVARADVPGGREADAERFSALVEALTGKRPRVYRKSGGEITMVCYEGHLRGFMHYAELADAIERWLEETSQRRVSPPPPSTVPTGPG